MDIEVYKNIPNKNLYILRKLYPNANIIKNEVKYMNLLEKVKSCGFNPAYYDLYGINVKIHKPYALFKYRQGECKFDEEWQKECRGSIINMYTFEYACRPFDKFFNYGETLADNLDFENPILVRDKEDGSLIKLWYSKDLKEWVFSTNGMIFAKESEVDNYTNYQDLVDIALKDTYNYTLDLIKDKLDINYTYMFELCTPKNIVVVPHYDYKLIFLAKRHNVLGNEIYEDEVFWLQPKQWHINTLQQAIDIIHELDERNVEDMEGLVITDINFKKVKMKTQTYLKIAYALDNPKNRNNLKWLWNNKEEREELSSYSELLKENYAKLDIIFEKVKECLKAEEVEFKKYPFKNKRELALSMDKFINPSWIFKLYDGWTLEDYLATIKTYSSFEKLLDTYKINKSIV